MMQMTATAAAGGDEMEVLTFNLQGETFALEAVMVQEILDMLPETRVPGASWAASSTSAAG